MVAADGFALVLAGDTNGRMDGRVSHPTSDCGRSLRPPHWADRRPMRGST